MAVMDRPGSTGGSFFEGLQRQRGQKCLTPADFSMGREIDMTLPCMNKLKTGLGSRFKLQGDFSVYRMCFHDWDAGFII